MPAKYGVKAFAFTWTAEFLLILTTILFFVSMSGKKDTYSSGTRSAGAGGFWNRKRDTTISRRSTVDGDSARTINKDEYA
jgi:hypothetical protein